jgi:peptidyl-prolyl cis-trans isomerase C
MKKTSVSFPSSLRRSRSASILGVAICLIVFHVRASGAEAPDYNEGEDESTDIQRARMAAQPWFVKRIEIGETKLPLSPVSVVILFVSIFYVIYYWSGRPVYADASHILLMDHSDEAKARLEDWRQKIGNDPGKFMQYAHEHSECPSKQTGGRLGRFRRYDMAPPFDRACFDPQSPLQTSIGPIQTQFGWHLIYIHDRQMPEK